MATLLIVEDEELTRTALRYLLTTKGYRVLEARDGQEGLEIFAQQPDTIDLVLSDLKMPRLDGLEMLQALRHSRPTVKQILMTSVPGDVQMWREQGMCDWLVKPFSMEQLLRKVSMALTTQPRMLEVEPGSGIVHFQLTLVEPTPDPDAWFVRVDSHGLLPEGIYPATLTDDAQSMRGQYTVFADAESGDAASLSQQGIFRRT